MIQSTAAHGGGRRSFWVLTGAYVVFLGVLAVNHAYHEAWRDELQAFDIGRQGTSLHDVYERARYEGHPRLWHWLIYAGSRLYPDVNLLKILGFATGAVAGGLLLFCSPFRPWIRVLLTFGYFTLWEYGTISRAYGLGYCFFLGTMALYPWNGFRLWGAMVLLLLLCQTSVFGGLLGCALMVSIAVWRGNELGGWRRLLRDRQSHVALAAFTAGLVFLAFQVRLPPDSLADYRFHLSAQGVGRALAYTWDVLVPMPKAGVDFWGHHLLNDLFPPIGAYARATLGLATAAGCLWMMRKNASAWTLFLITCGGVWLVILKEPGGLRHHGHLLMAFIGAFWLMASQETRRPGNDKAESSTLRFPVPNQRRQGNWLFAAVCMIQCVCGLHASVMDWVLPFSGSAAGADMVRQHVPADAVVIAHMDCPCSAVAIRLNRPLVYPQSDVNGTVRGTYIVFNAARRQRVTISSLLELAQREASRSGQPAFLLLSEDVTGPELGRQARLVGQTSQCAIQTDEVYRLYSVEWRPAGSVTRPGGVPYSP